MGNKSDKLFGRIKSASDDLRVWQIKFLEDISTATSASESVTTSLEVVTVQGDVVLPSGKRSISFMNTGNNNAEVNGATLKAGYSINYPELSNRDTYGNITYNVLTSELTILTVG